MAHKHHLTKEEEKKGGKHSHEHHSHMGKKHEKQPTALKAKVGKK